MQEFNTWIGVKPKSVDHILLNFYVNKVCATYFGFRILERVVDKRQNDYIHFTSFLRLNKSPPNIQMKENKTPFLAAISLFLREL